MRTCIWKFETGVSISRSISTCAYWCYRNSCGFSLPHPFVSLHWQSLHEHGIFMFEYARFWLRAQCNEFHLNTQLNYLSNIYEIVVSIFIDKNIRWIDLKVKQGCTSYTVEFLLSIPLDSSALEEVTPKTGISTTHNFWYTSLSCNQAFCTFLNLLSYYNGFKRQRDV